MRLRSLAPALLATFLFMTSASPVFSAPAGVTDAVPASAEAPAELRWLDTELFSVQIPTSWTELKAADLEASRTQAERIAREVFPPDLSSAAPLDRVLWLNAFQSADESTRLFLLISEIPPPTGAGRPYIERKVIGYADWQRAQRAVDRVKVSEIEELNGMPAVEVVVDLPEGSTLYTVHLWTSVYRDRVGTVVAVANAGALAHAQEAIVRLVSSVKPSPKVAAVEQGKGLRTWLRDKLWIVEDASTPDAFIKRVMVVLICFSLCFAVSLRLLYEAAVVWYRWRGMEDRVIEMARRAARDMLRLGHFYSQRVILSCALVSMTMTTAALMWLTAP